MPHLVPHGQVKLFFWSSFTEDKRDLEGDQISEEVRFSFQLTHVPSRIEAVQLIGAYPIAYMPLLVPAPHVISPSNLAQRSSCSEEVRVATKSPVNSAVINNASYGRCQLGM